MAQVLTKYPGKTIHRLAAIFLGFYLTELGLNFFFPYPIKPIYIDLKETPQIN